MRIATSKKKLSAVNRRLRDRSRLSFLFVLFFFGLFSLIIVMESLMADEDKTLLPQDGEETDSENDDYSSWDISYEDQTVFDGGKQSSSSNSKLSFSRSSVEKLPLSSPSSNGHVKNENSGSGSTEERRSAVHPSLVTTKTVTPVPAKMSPIQPDWQKVTGTKERFFVYSAYYNSLNDHIRVIGATKTKTQQHVQCRFYDNDTRPYVTVEGTVKTIRENWNLKFSACFIICYLSDKRRMPRYVSVLPSSSSSSASASNILRVQFASEKAERSIVDFSVCVKPIHFNYDNLLPFLEWMEFHKLMGVNHFTFYNHTIGSKVACLLKEYGEEVEVLPWSLPFISQKEIRTEGLFVALNDCVYRHRGASKYLLLVDLDEMIVPRRTANYSQLIEQLDTLSNKKKIGAYSLQNAFFYLQWPDDITKFSINENPLAEIVSQKLLTLTKTRRRARLHPHKQRSKYICDPEKVVEAGNHFVWEMATGYFTLSVPPHLGALHHYRVCEFGGDQCTKSPSVIDKSSHSFGQQLAIRVANKLQQLATKCNFQIDKILQLPTTATKNGNSFKPHA